MNDVVLICPKCKGRKVIGYDDWVRSCLPLNMERVRCDNPLCEKKPMNYHKDVKAK